MNSLENFSQFPEIGDSIALNDQAKTELSADQKKLIKEQVKAFIKKESKRSAKKIVKKELRKNRKKKRKFVKWERVVSRFQKVGDTILKNLQKVIANAFTSGITTGITKIFNTLTGKLFHGRGYSIS